MKMKSCPSAIVLGDSFNNTLGLVRSLGQSGAYVILILVGEDRLFVRKSRYADECIQISTIKDCERILREKALINRGAFLICSNDKAAKWTDDNESWLSKYFLTPMRGKCLGDMFDKPMQCKLAKDFGVTIPKSAIYKSGCEFPEDITLPILLKPANSNEGEKSDIHICCTKAELNNALNKDSKCRSYIVQEYIQKDYEINLIGVSTDKEIIIPGGIRKIRHYPTIYSPCSFGVFLPIIDLGIDIVPIKKMIKEIGYKGPFSVEFLRKGDKSYFMEINFRHDGLAYSATASGVNLPGMYVRNLDKRYKINPTYMMDLSIDYCHVKKGNLSRRDWWADFLRTGCQLNFNRIDPMPTVLYYLSKFGLAKVAKSKVYQDKKT